MRLNKWVPFCTLQEGSTCFCLDVLVVVVVNVLIGGRTMTGGISRNKTSRMHNAGDPSPGDCRCLFAELNLQFSFRIHDSFVRTIQRQWCLTSFPYRFFPFVFRVVISLATDYQAAANTRDQVFMLVFADNGYFRPIISAACFKMSFSIFN